MERVKLSELDGRADMRIAATNLMMGSIANLEIEILQAWKGGKPLKLKAYPDNSAEAGKSRGDSVRDGSIGEKSKVKVSEQPGGREPERASETHSERCRTLQLGAARSNGRAFDCRFQAS